jgi:hypothetical protein
MDGISWTQLFKAVPTALKVIREIIEAARSGASNEEIRARIASPDVILDEELDELRAAKDDLDEFIRTGR